MKEKGNTGMFLAVLLLGICLVAGICILAFFGITQRTKKIDQNVNQVLDTESNQSQESQKETTKSHEIDGFVVGEDAATSTPTEEDGTEAGTGDSENASDEYLCAAISERQLTKDDVKSLQEGTYEGLPTGKTIIQMVINELYAKYGYEFTNEEIRNYFEQKSWYQEITVRSSDMNGLYQQMNDIEKANIDFLRSYEGEGV